MHNVINNTYLGNGLELVFLYYKMFLWQHKNGEVFVATITTIKSIKIITNKWYEKKIRDKLSKTCYFSLHIASYFYVTKKCWKAYPTIFLWIFVRALEEMSIIDVSKFTRSSHILMIFPWKNIKKKNSLS